MREIIDMNDVRLTFVAVLFLYIAPLANAQDETATLRSLAKPFFSVGVGIGVGITESQEDWKLLTTQFEYVTPENCMKVAAIQRQAGQFNFESADRFIDFASQHDLNVVGHCLVWAKDDRTPEWFFKDGDELASPELVLSRMKTHIENVVGRYKGRIAMWDVVNEALGDGSEEYLRDSGWSRATGEEFIVKAFQYADAADPDALLIYNDYRCDTPGKRRKLVRLARMLKSRNAPVDAIGLQGHYELDSIPYEGLEEMFEAMRDLGFKIVVSELDIDVVKRGRWWADGGKHRHELSRFNPYKDGCPDEVLQRQADQYARLFELFIKYQDVVHRVSFWNLHDGKSWLNYFPWKRVNHPLLFDRERTPKPAFDALVRVLSDASNPRKLGRDRTARPGDGAARRRSDSQGPTGQRPPVSWVNSDLPDEAGLVHKVLASKQLAHDVGYVVWTPTDFDTSGDTKYPVIYFLHGMGGNETSDARGFSGLIRRSISKGELPPVICVFPNGGRSGYRDTVEKMIVDELIPLIDKNYPTDASARSRVVAGFSMGGAGAVRLSMLHPNLFCGAASWGGGMWRDAEEILIALEKGTAKLKHNSFSTLLINGDRDRPNAFDSLAAKLRSLEIPHEVIVLDDTPHNLGLYYQRSGSAMSRFLSRQLRLKTKLSESQNSVD